MIKEKLKTIEEIKTEIARVKETFKVDHSTFGKGRLSGLWFALGIKLTFDSEGIENDN